MDKIVIFIALFTVNIIFAQEQKAPTTYQYTPHSIGVSTRFGGGFLGNVRESSYVSLSTTTLDFYAGKRVGLSKYNTLIQFRFSTPYIKYNIPYPVLQEFRWGLLLGGSQYVFDKRSPEGKGWSMLINGGVLFDLPTIERMKTPEQSVLILGIELDFKAIYNLHKYVAITFGPSFSYQTSYTLRNDKLTDAEGFPIPTTQGIHWENAFVWGLSVGLIF
ncbi:MAG: hypothetical protein ACRCWI_08575 [Brevinema sp.]